MKNQIDKYKQKADMEVTDNMHHSLKAKIMILLAAMVTGLVLLILAINSTFITRFYSNEKKRDIVHAYNEVGEILTRYERCEIDASEMSNQIEKVTNPVGVSLFIVDSGWNTIYSSKNQGGIDDRDRMVDSIFAKPSEKIEIIEKKENYTVQKAYDKKMGDYYIEIWGSYAGCNSENYIAMLRMPVQSIKESIAISNRFIAYVGLAVGCTSIVVAYVFSSYITKPVKELSNIAERVAEMDFTARYTGNDKSEIGLLGNSINAMSEKLERNISQLKSANIELQKDIENKNKIDESRREFLSNISHELKTPIALIQGYAEGLKEGISDDPESMDFYCDVIMDEASKMNDMVKKLLTLNQMEWNEEPVIERFNVTELIQSVISNNGIRTSQNGINVIFDQKEPVYVWGDEYKIEEVVTNYFSNAINHCEFDKVIKVAIEKNEDTVRVSVFNTGKNIPEEDIPKIWDKFYKVDKARTREYGGNGIGLSIVKAIMESNNSGYGVINHSNGVEFWFELDCKNE